MSPRKISIDESRAPEAGLGNTVVVGALDVTATCTNGFLAHEKQTISQHSCTTLNRDIDCRELGVFDVAGIARTHWLENHNMSFFVGRSAVFNPSGYDV